MGVGDELKHKVRTYFFNRHVIEQVYDPNEEKEILSALAPNLETALLEENNIAVLGRSENMQKFRRETLTKLTTLLKKTILAPEHVVFSRLTKDIRLWFIEKGTIEEFTDRFENSDMRKLVTTYDEKEPTVGWINFLTQNCYKTLAKAKLFTIAYELEEGSFLGVLREDVKEYHRFLHMKHTLTQKNRQYINKCISCDRYTHSVVDCPRIHFVRRDAKKLAQQSKHLRKYIDEQGKVKKVNRKLIKYDWKTRFTPSEADV